MALFQKKAANAHSVKWAKVNLTYDAKNSPCTESQCGLCMQISTYSYSFPNLEDGYSTYMVPVLDLLNHAAKYAANVMINMEEDSFVAKALKDINEGDEVS